jgi:alkanesulfonate monooxygenase SsuD/methylene tetrahydromethanopterin reductase-like flavin-dependent oxidoreductase (luciferase family)
MRFGIGGVCTDETLQPSDVARRVEELGLESLFLGEHTHIPTVRVSPYPLGELTRNYIDRYVQNHVVGATGEEGETGAAEIGFDGFSECWFRDETQFLEAVESDTWAAAVEDAQNVFDMNQMWGTAPKENVVIAPQLVGT